MSVVIAFEEDGPCRKKLTIEVPLPAVEAEMGRVIRDYAKRVRLPGFRVGKAPVAVVRQRFREEIERDVVERLMPRYWKQAEAEKSLEPLLPPHVEDVQLRDGEPMVFTASVDTRPPIELGDLDGFELPERETEPGEAEVVEALTDLRRAHASWVPVERPAARGDLVLGRAREVGEDGELHGDERPVEVEVGGEGVPEDLTLALTGVTAGRTVEHVREHHGGHGGEADHTHKHTFRIEVTAVKERELPELDDELAGRIGTFENVGELRQALVDRLRFQKQAVRRRDRERALLEQLRARYPIALPERVVEQEERNLLQEYAEALASQGVDVEKAPIDWGEVGRDLKPQAERRVHVRLLLDAVADARALKLDEAEFERFLTGLAAHRKKTAFAMRQELAETGRLQTVRQQLLREQAIRLLLGEGPDAGAAVTEVGET